MTDTPEDWVLIEAAKRARAACPDDVAWEPNDILFTGIGRALCDMIERYEQPPVDRKLLCAEEAVRTHAGLVDLESVSVRAIELWEEGFGRD